jgi:hypothetical protein
MEAFLKRGKTFNYLLCKKYKKYKKYEARVCKKKGCKYLRQFFQSYFCRYPDEANKKINRRRALEIALNK